MKTCLVVDDSTFDRKLVEICASKNGFLVRTASSGEEALLHCSTSLPDLVLLDWEMEGMNGIELLKKLRLLDGGREIPMIICTSHTHPSFIGHAYVHGATSYITKPITPEKLEEKLQSLAAQ